MKKIIAVNASPRSDWNTGILVEEAARGAREAGNETEVIDLYRLEKYTGCISCFACKKPANKGKCVCKDGLTPVLEKIRRANGLILGTPNYLGDVSAGFRALYERLIFQYLTYNSAQMCCNVNRIPVLFIMTSNAPESAYEHGEMYGHMLDMYRNTLSNIIGPVKTLIYGDTMQVSDYSRYEWTMFDPEKKKRQHDEILPRKKEEAFHMGYKMAEE